MLLHASDTLFTWAEVTSIEFDNLPLRAAPTVLLGSLDEHYSNMNVIFKAEQMAAYFRFSQNGTPAVRRATPAPSAPAANKQRCERSGPPTVDPAPAHAAGCRSSPDYNFSRA
jgi:hypothetical protein